jgi:hypothetical protein
VSPPRYPGHANARPARSAGRRPAGHRTSSLRSDMSYPGGRMHPQNARAATRASRRVTQEHRKKTRSATVRRSQGCLGGHQLSRSDPGRSVRTLPGFGVHRRRLRTALSHGLTAARLEPSVRQGAAEDPFRLALRKNPKASVWGPV